MRRLTKLRALFALLIAAAVALPVMDASVAWADTAKSVVKITDEIVPQPANYNQVFFDHSYDLTYTSGSAVLSSTLDGLSGGVVDDVLIVTVTRPDGTTQESTYDYSEGCGGLAVRPPRDIAGLLQAGTNHVQIRFKDQCGGSMGAWTMYLVTDAPPAPQLPEVASIAPDAPSDTDTMLTRSVTITPVNNGVTADHYEYGWAPADGSAAPTKPTQQSAQTHARLNYGVASPNSDWLLFARGVLADGTPGPWSTPTPVHTPVAPQLLALGDSVASGHHNDVGDNGKTVCEDPNYGYAGAFAQRWLGALPSQWQVPNQYTNLAFSGFATQPRAGSGIDGSVLTGGRDACQKPGISAPLGDAAVRLTNAANSWNRVVVSAGVDDTNWAAMMKILVAQQLVAEAVGVVQSPVRGQLKFGSLTEQQCQNVITQQWNGITPVVRSSITSGVSKIVAGLRLADPNVKITWVDYYNVAGTGLSRADAKLPPDVPVTCQKPIDQALNKLHQAIMAGLPSDVSFVASDPAMHGNIANFQTLYIPTEVLHGDPTNPPGWPHPTRAGGQAIAALIDPQ